MTGSSGVEGIPVPDDAIAISRGGASGWTTQVASLEDLTTWYLDHLTDLGWVLDGPSSVMDPAQGAERGLGHATSAVYCPTDPDHHAVAVNVGWPDGDDSGATVVLAIVTGVDQACS
jgi:hypothetical protein